MNVLEELKELLNNSYSPYSNYKVASMVVMKDGKKFKGVNVENVAYAPSICAERSAIASAISAGYKKGDFDKIYVTNDHSMASPCGMCRQVIAEFFDKDSEIILVDINTSEMKSYTIDDLLPYSFSQDDLK